MRKWNRYCRLKTKLKDESGITLVELLAALSILTVVILLAGSIHIFGQKQFSSQTESASQANDFSYALADMTTELRKYKPKEVTVVDNEIKINDVVVYKQDGTNILKNKSVIVSSVGEFQPSKPEGANFIDIKIIKTNQTAGNKDYHTTIYFRGEADE